MRSPFWVIYIPKNIYILKNIARSVYRFSYKPLHHVSTFVYSSWPPWKNAEYSANTQTINNRRPSKLIGVIMQMLVKPDVYYTYLFIYGLKPFYQRHTITARGRWHSFLTPIKGRLCSRKGPRVNRPLLATETASVATGALWPSHLNIVWITCAGLPVLS